MQAASAETVIGRVVLGRYQIVRLLARGGMGSIYLARSKGAAGFVKPVIIKRVLPDLMGDDSIVKMFAREARILATLRHPGIVAILDFGEEGDDYFMALEYVEGYNLLKWMKFVKDTRGNFPVEVALHIVIEVLEALHHAHTLTDSDGQPFSIVHRDVTPSNVLVDVHGKVKLLDFGIARSANDATEPSADGGQVKGKFPYIAPEIFGGRPPGPVTDVYSTAVLLHEVLAGRNEIAAPDMESTILNALNLTPTRLDQLRKDVSKELATVVGQGLSKRPQGRFNSAKEFATALRIVRRSSSEQAEEEIKRMVKEDFRHPKMVEQSQGNDLITLERAWRTSLGPPPPELITEDAPRDSVVAAVNQSQQIGESAPTTIGRRLTGMNADRSEPAIPPVRPQSSISWPVVALSGILITAGVVLAIVFLKPPAQKSEVTYIQPSTATDEDVLTVVARADVQVVPPAPEDRDAAVARSVIDAAVNDSAVGAGRDSGHSAHAVVNNATQGPVDPRTLLTRTFSRQRSKISKCIESNPTDVSGTGSIEVRFEIDRTGKVLNASITPVPMNTTGFGRCVTGVARGINFGPQPESIIFRIPVALQRVNGR